MSTPPAPSILTTVDGMRLIAFVRAQAHPVKVGALAEYTGLPKGNVLATLNAGAELGYVRRVRVHVWERGPAGDADITARDPAYNPLLLLRLPAGRIARPARRRRMPEILAKLP